jgi:hypothetical protein
MEILVAVWLLSALQRRLKRTYTPEELDEIARQSSPGLLLPRDPSYRWWKYSGLR